MALDKFLKNEFEFEAQLFCAQLKHYYTKRTAIVLVFIFSLLAKIIQITLSMECLMISISSKLFA